MTGQRLPDGEHRYHEAPDGSYWRLPDGVWRVKTPNGMAGNLGNHEVVEHEDGTITVAPSILCDWPNRTEPKRYHGFLRAGVWETLGDTHPMP